MGGGKPGDPGGRIFPEMIIVITIAFCYSPYFDAAIHKSEKTDKVPFKEHEPVTE